MQEKFNEAAVATYLGAKRCASNVKEGIIDFFNDENGISGIVVAVILVLIAIVILVIFQDNLTKLMESMWKSITGESGNLDGFSE